jgi:hypothetical protein
LPATATLVGATDEPHARPLLDPQQEGTTIITTPTAVSTRVPDEHMPVQPVQFSHLTPDIPADQQGFAHAEHDAAPLCSPMVFRAPLPAERRGCEVIAP